MCLHGHIPNAQCLDRRSNDESYLKPSAAFVRVDQIATTTNKERLDGCYLVVEDSERKQIIRSGAATVGLLKRWEGHKTAASLRTSCAKASTFYMSYPAESVSKKINCHKGSFDQLIQLCGVAFDRRLRNQIIDLFEWNQIEVQELGKLSASLAERQSMEDKKYRHIIYLFEVAYAIALKPTDNVSSNPGCEWQLRYFGREETV
jgi:hypothetical protein